MPLPKAPNKPATILEITPALQARATRPAARTRTSTTAADDNVVATVAAAPAGKGRSEPAQARLLTAPVGDAALPVSAPVGKKPQAPQAEEAAPASGRARRGSRRQTGSAATEAASPEAPVVAKVAAPAVAAAPVLEAVQQSRVSKRRGRPDANAEMPKLFVLDTNVLMHDPTALFRFAEHDIYLPMMTLEELDNHKRGMSEVARNARAVSRTLDELIAKTGATDFDQGVPLAALGNNDAKGRLHFQTQTMAAMLPSTLPVGKADNQILGVVRALQERHPGRETVLVSKDINMRIKAHALGLPAEDYFNDQVLEDTDLLYTGTLVLPPDFWDTHGKGVESWQQAGSTFYRVTGPLVQSFHVNQFVSLDGEMPLVAQVKQVNGRTAVLQTLRDYAHLKNAVWGITARNREQNFALNLLMNPEIDFVSLLGQAGTGKTLLALAAGLAQTIEGKRFSEIIMTRATVPVGEDIGYLPGTEEEKMQPWMGALEDNLEVLNQGDPAAGEWGRQATNDIIRSRVKVKALSFMRGRTFINKFLIIDEAQNLTPKQMKTLVTRAGPGTKVICLGNIAQIDTPYLTEGSSGLTYVVDRFKGWAHSGHVTLQRGERSRLADFAADVL